MSYEAIDVVLTDWAARHGLRLYTRYQDSEVRTVFVEGTGPERGQVWIDPPGADGQVAVHAAVYRKRGRDNEKTDLSATVNGLESVLEIAYATVAGRLAAAS